MLNDINIGGVFLPGLLVIALISLACTLLLVPLFSFSRFLTVYRHFFPVPAGR